MYAEPTTGTIKTNSADAEHTLSHLATEVERSITAVSTGVSNVLKQNASDVEQRSWMADEYRQSIFTYCVIEGLKGDADGAADDRKDQRVNAWELCRYVQKRVEEWAQPDRVGQSRPCRCGREQLRSFTRNPALEIVGVHGHRHADLRLVGEANGTR